MMVVMSATAGSAPRWLEGGAVDIVSRPDRVDPEPGSVGTDDDPPVVALAIAAPLLGLDWILGAELAAASMAGDLLASFLKRRLGLKVHAQAIGLDQIPEALLPLLILQSRLELSASDIVLLVAAFAFLEAVLSYVLYKLRIRERPY